MALQPVHMLARLICLLGQFARSTNRKNVKDLLVVLQYKMMYKPFDHFDGARGSFSFTPSKAAFRAEFTAFSVAFNDCAD